LVTTIAGVGRAFAIASIEAGAPAITGTSVASGTILATLVTSVAKVSVLATGTATLVVTIPGVSSIGIASVTIFNQIAEDVPAVEAASLVPIASVATPVMTSIEAAIVASIKATVAAIEATSLVSAETGRPLDISSAEP